MRALLRIFFTFLLFLTSSPAFGAETRVDCGDYSFELPQGFELRNIELSNEKFDKTLSLNSPFNQKELANATITCVREKKTEYQTFSLPNKEKINFLTAASRSIPLQISATENTRQDNTWFKFSLLEERTTNSREIKGRERFMVAVEMDATNDDWHTIIFVSDFRSFEGFFDADDFKSQVTRTAIQIMDSVRKKLP